MQKTFIVKVSSSVTPDHALGEAELTDVISSLVFQTESRYGMGSVFVQVLDADENGLVVHDELEMCEGGYR